MNNAALPICSLAHMLWSLRIARDKTLGSATAGHIRLIQDEERMTERSRLLLSEK
jgi:hypothetical protein